MRFARMSRARIGLGFALALALTATLLVRTTTTTPGALASDDMEPRFLAWSGEPYDDGLNHFLVALEPSWATESARWLRLADDEHLVAAGIPPPEHSEIDVAELEAAVQGETASHDDKGIVATIKGDRRVSDIRPIGFGFYAVTGSIDRETLLDIPGVSQVTIDTGLEATTVDPYYPSQWSLENSGTTSDPWAVTADADIDAPDAWHRTRGNGVVVAVIDSGTDTSHADLADNIWANPGEQCGNGIDDDGNGYTDDCVGWDFANDDATVDDLIGHGTHVAGIIAAQADNGIGISGVAYEADLMVLKVGDGAPALSAAIEAIGYAIDNGARIINASWLIDDPGAPHFLNAALDAAERAGVLVVTGAGNGSVNVDDRTIYPATSRQDNIITVGASTATDEPASFSGYGPQSVDLFAPGEHIVSTIPGGYGVYSGSSMAAPMVSGAAALLWAATPAASYSEVKGALLDRSDGPNDGVTAFRGLAVSEGRLNIDRSIYTRLFQPSVMYSFANFNSFEPDIGHTVTVNAKTVDPWSLPPQIPAMYRVGLYVPLDGHPMAVVGHEIVHLSEAGDSASTTDGTGRTLVGQTFERQQISAFVQDGDTTTLTMTLPAGTYAFVTEIVDVTHIDNPMTMGDPSAVFFRVSSDGTIVPMPGFPIDAEPPTPTTLPDDVGSASTSTTSRLPTASSTTTPVPPPSDASTTTSTTLTTASTTTTLTSNTTTTTTAVTTTGAPDSSTTTSLAPTTTGAPGATTTTSQPANGHGGTTTTTTRPTTTTTTRPTPDDSLVISGINPDQGPTAGGTLVTISGENLPESPLVFFGDRRAEIVSTVAPTFILVDTPAGPPGLVDVTVKDQLGGDQATFPAGFLYVGPGEEPTTTTTTWPDVTNTTAGPTTTLAVTTTNAHPATTTADQPPTITGSGGSLDDWLDSVLRTPDGLTLAPPAADDRIGRLPTQLWAGALCDQPVCPGWVLED